MLFSCESVSCDQPVRLVALSLSIACIGGRWVISVRSRQGTTIDGDLIRIDAWYVHFYIKLASCRLGFHPDSHPHKLMIYIVRNPFINHGVDVEWTNGQIIL